MLLKRAAMAGGLSVLLVLSTGVGVASAKGKVKAQGTVTCGGLHGTGALNPGLSVTGSPGGMKINYKATFAGNCNSNVTTPPGDVVTGGSVKGSGFYDPPPLGGNASACVNFLGGDVVGTIKETIQWTTTGPPIAPTHITYQMQTGTVTAPPATITLVAPPGTAVKTGSFALPAVPNLTQLVTDLPLPSCPAGAVFKTFNIVDGQIAV